eukprot:216476_1
MASLRGATLGGTRIPRLPGRPRPRSNYKVYNQTPAEVEFHEREIDESIILQESSRAKNLRNKIIFEPDCRQDFLNFLESGPVPREKLMEIDDESLTMLLEPEDAEAVLDEIYDFPGVRDIGMENLPPLPESLYGTTTPLVDVTVKHSPEEHAGHYQVNFDLKNRHAWLEFRKGYVIKKGSFTVPGDFGDESLRILACLRGTSEENAAKLHKIRCFPGIKSIETLTKPPFSNFSFTPKRPVD